jgi:hypothetical protein
MQIRLLTDGAPHAIYVADDRIGHVRQVGAMVEACDRLGRELGRFGDADSAIRAVMRSADRPRPASHATARLAAE